MARLKRSVQKEAFWRLVVDDHAASGLSVRAFCQRKVVSEASFYFWRRELAVRDREASLPPDTPAMLPVRVFESEQAPALTPEADDRASGCEPPLIDPGPLTLRKMVGWPTPGVNTTGNWPAQSSGSPPKSIAITNVAASHSSPTTSTPASPPNRPRQSIRRTSRGPSRC